MGLFSLPSTANEFKYLFTVDGETEEIILKRDKSKEDLKEDPKEDPKEEPKQKLRKNLEKQEHRGLKRIMVGTLLAVLERVKYLILNTSIPMKR